MTPQLPRPHDLMQRQARAFVPVTLARR